MSKKNRFISLILSLILIFNFPFTTSAANVPLSEEVKVRYTFYKAMVLLGIFAKNRDDVGKVINWGIDKLPELYTFVENGVKTAKEGFLNITDSIWYSSRSKVQESFNVGNNLIPPNSDGLQHNYSYNVYYPQKMNPYLKQYFFNAPPGCQVVTWRYPGLDNHAIIAYQIYGNYRYDGSLLTIERGSTYNEYEFRSSTGEWRKVSITSPLTYDYQRMAFTPEDAWIRQPKDGAIPVSTNIFASDVVSVSDWDYINPNTKERSVVIPQEGIGDYSDVVDKTYTDYVSENVSTGEVEVPVETEVPGLLKRILDGILSIPGLIVSGIKSVLVELFVPTESIANLQDVILSKLNYNINLQKSFDNTPLEFTLKIYNYNQLVKFDNPLFKQLRGWFSAFVYFAFSIVLYRKITGGITNDDY